MYLVGNSFHVSFKWVVIISTKQEAAHTQSAKVSTCYTLWHFGDWSLITGRGGYKLHKSCEVGDLKRGGCEEQLQLTFWQNTKFSQLHQLYHPQHKNYKAPKTKRNVSK